MKHDLFYESLDKVFTNILIKQIQNTEMRLLNSENDYIRLEKIEECDKYASLYEFGANLFGNSVNFGIFTVERTSQMRKMDD